MMLDDAEESQLKGPIDFVAPYTSAHEAILADGDEPSEDF
jgi:hypothetical protein